jgi:hypothetical protein
MPRKRMRGREYRIYLPLTLDAQVKALVKRMGEDRRSSECWGVSAYAALCIRRCLKRDLARLDVDVVENKEVPPES